ncbi:MULTISPECIES: hypothetical protein [unclassified Marinovum]
MSNTTHRPGQPVGQTTPKSHDPSVKDRVSDSANDAKDKIADTAANVRDSAAQTSENLRSRAADTSAQVQNKIAEGTEMLTEEARARVVAARRRAIDAHRSAKVQASRGADALSSFYQRQPLVVGALALAAGAAIAGMLPRTKVEDDYMGEHSDRLYEEAERVFQEETRKLQAVAGAARDEAEKIAGEFKNDLDSGAPGDQTVTEALANTAKSAGKRVAGAARDKADDEKLGEPTA